MKYNIKKMNDLVFSEQRKKKTLPQIAKSIGIGATTLQKVNAGDSIPTLDILCKIAVYFKKDINYFFDFGKDEQSYIVAEPSTEYGKKSDIDYKQQAEMYKNMYDALIDKLVENQKPSTESKAS